MAGVPWRARSTRRCAQAPEHSLGPPKACRFAGSDGVQHRGEARRQRHLVQVEDELREVLDGVDVVVRRRRDERHARLAAPQVGDVGAHLLAGQLPALACSRTGPILTARFPSLPPFLQPAA